MIWEKGNRVISAKKKAAARRLEDLPYVCMRGDLTAFRPGSFPVYFASSHERFKHVAHKVPWSYSRDSVVIAPAY